MASVRLIQNRQLDDVATSPLTSSICEPTAAASGNNIFVTGNWFATRSTTGGANFAFVDPFTAFPSAAGGFCCDQIVLYDPSRDIWIWILQYIRSGGSNIFRVAISRGGSFGSWYYWDFSPRALNPAWTDMWFDYPDAAISANHLYITFNAFNSAGRFQRAFVFKLPLDTLRNGLGLSVVVYDSQRFAPPHSRGYDHHVLREPQWRYDASGLQLAGRVRDDRLVRRQHQRI